MVVFLWLYMKNKVVEVKVQFLVLIFRNSEDIEANLFGN